MSLQDDGEMIPVGELADGSVLMMQRDRNRGAIHPSVAERFGEFLHLVGPTAEGALKIEVDVGRPVGVCHCLQRRPQDEVFYARQRGPFRGYYPFVRRQPAQSTWITVTMVRHDDPQEWFEIVAGYIGRYAPALPRSLGDAESLQFWRDHALSGWHLADMKTQLEDPPAWAIR